MNWGSAGNFFAMGGYGSFVWGAYVVTVVLIVAEILSLRARRRRTVKEVAQRARGGTIER
jgi:heme exporter protein D